MDSARALVFYNWCVVNFPECRTAKAPTKVNACAIDTESFLRWHADGAESPMALLDQLHRLLNRGVPHASQAASLHLGVMNRSFGTVAGNADDDDTVKAHLYVKNWGLADDTTIASYLIDRRDHLTAWPFPDQELRMVHFDWTVFAWQWRVLVTREMSGLYDGYIIYNGLDEEEIADQLRAYRTAHPSSSRSREIQAAIAADQHSRILIDDNDKTNDARAIQTAQTARNMQRRWPGLLTALRTLMALFDVPVDETKNKRRRHDDEDSAEGDAQAEASPAPPITPVPKSLFLHTCAPDGLWFALVCTLYAHDQSLPVKNMYCQWRNQGLVDVALVAHGMVKRFKETRVALAVCLMLWVDTQCQTVEVYNNVFERLLRGTIRPSSGADFSLSLSCLVHGRAASLQVTSDVLKTCNALCRALWQRKHAADYSQHHPDRIVYPRIFWEAWGVSSVPDFTAAVSECLKWINFSHSCLVNAGFSIGGTAPVAETLASTDPLYYGLTSRV